MKLWIKNEWTKNVEGFIKYYDYSIFAAIITGN